MSIDLSSPKRIHVIGAGGSGMSAIASVLASMGHKVSGSDAADGVALSRLKDAGVDAYVGHNPVLVATVDAVAASTAIKADDPEVMAARNAGIPVLRRADVLAAIAAVKRTVAVAGTHGKTTTSTLAASVLIAGGLDPSYIIGGEILGRGNGAHWSDGDWFVVEADESDGTFLELGAEAAIVTNVEPDHLEHYGGWPQLQDAFARFVAVAPGPKIICADDEGAARLAAATPDAFTYGTTEAADYRIVDLELGRFKADFSLTHQGQRQAVTINAPGLHNVRNAVAAMALGHQLGVLLEDAARGVANYGGVGRRFQPRGEKSGITFVDDYAHLPSEVSATVAAATDGDWGRVVAVFQPHRYSRTEQVGADFGGAFDGVDLLVLADVYAAGETPREGVTGQIVVDAVTSAADAPTVIYEQDRAGLARRVARELKAGDLCLTLGAGDVTKLADEIQEIL